MNNLVFVQFNARLKNKNDKKKKKDKLLASDATNAQSWIVDGCDDDDDESVDGVEAGSGLTWDAAVEAANEILQPRRSGRNARDESEIREPDEEDFVSDGTEDGMDEEDDFELESDKELDD